MNKISALLILLFASFNLDAQCLYNRTAFETFIEKNISNIDPIEGFWSVTFISKLYLNGELVKSDSKSQIKDWAIIKDGSSFRVCDIYGENRTAWIVEFSPTVNPNIYLYKKSNDSEITTANAVMTSIGLLEYSFEVGQKELKNTWKEKYQAGLREYREFKWIKTYPLLGTIQQKQKSSGTGFAISSKGIIATCNHVVENSDKIIVRGINNDFDKAYKAKVIARDNNNDLALIQIEDPLFRSLGIIPFMITDKTIEVGSAVFVLGYPMRASMGDEIKLTNGIISSKSGFKGDITAYQISAPVQPGNSGGPLFDDNGNLVGIINAKNVAAENASYAIKTNYLRNLMETLTPYPKIPSINTLSVKSLPQKVKVLKNFTYIIETN